MRLKENIRDILTLAVYVIVSVILVGGSIFYIEGKGNNMLPNTQIDTEDYVEEKNTQDRENPETKNETVKLSDTYISIPKMGNNASLGLKNCYMDREFDITINGWEKNKLIENDIARNCRNFIYYGSYTKDGRDFVKKIFVEENQEEGIISLKLRLNHVYETQILEDEEYFYIYVIRPRQLYERIIVIDAGHGGSSSGTYSSSSRMYEKDVNLDITFKLKELLDGLEKSENGRLKVYYTRLTDDNIYLSPRVKLANDVEADAFVSIHCNGNYDTTLYGAELMCAPSTGNHPPYSKELGDFCFDAVIKATGLYERERYVLDDIYILKHSRTPACLLEIGYLTHDEDREYLENEKNRTEIAGGIFKGLTDYLKWIDEK